MSSLAAQQLGIEERAKTASDHERRNLEEILFTEINVRALIRTKTRGKDGRYSAKKTEELSWRRYVHFFLINIR